MAASIPNDLMSVLDQAAGIPPEAPAPEAPAIPPEALAWLNQQPPETQAAYRAQLGLPSAAATAAKMSEDAAETVREAAPADVPAPAPAPAQAQAPAPAPAPSPARAPAPATGKPLTTAKALKLLDACAHGGMSLDEARAYIEFAGTL